MSGGVWPDWLFLSGNCDFVHDTADEAARDGEAAAVQASESVSYTHLDVYKRQVGAFSFASCKSRLPMPLP